jgi:hypothetical protein
MFLQSTLHRPDRLCRDGSLAGDLWANLRDNRLRGFPRIPINESAHDRGCPVPREWDTPLSLPRPTSVGGR